MVFVVELQGESAGALSCSQLDLQKLRGEESGGAALPHHQAPKDSTPASGRQQCSDSGSRRWEASLSLSSFISLDKLLNLSLFQYLTCLMGNIFMWFKTQKILTYTVKSPSHC